MRFRLRFSAVLFCVLSTTATVQAAPSAQVIPVDGGPQTTTYLGSTIVKFVGVNPIVWSAAASTNTTVTAAPQPGFMPASTGNAAKPAPAPAPPGRGGAALPPPPPPPVYPPCGDPTDIAAGIGTAASDMTALSQFAEQSIQADPNLTSASGGSAADNSSGLLVTKINTSSQFSTARTCLSNLQVAAADPNAKTTADQKTAIAGLVTAYGSILAVGVTLSQVEPQQTVTCKGLLGGSSSSAVTLTLSARLVPSGTTTGNQVSTVTVKCLGNVAVSTGFVFSGIPQATFTPVPVNAGAAAATIASIQQQTSSSTHAIPYAFAHVGLPGFDCNAHENCTFLTFGAGVTSSSNSAANNIDFAAGLTQSLFRYLYLTVGANLGQQTVLPPGYSLGAPIALGTSIPTTTVERAGFFVGFSFGARP